MITSVLNSAFDRLAISLSLSCIFSGALKCSVIRALFIYLFICLGASVTLRGRALGVPGAGWGNPSSCAVTLCVEKGSESEQWCLLCSLPVFSHFPCYPQVKWPLLVLIPVWVVCVYSRTPWVSPTNSPVTLGVSPTAASTPTDFYSQRF